MRSSAGEMRDGGCSGMRSSERRGLSVRHRVDRSGWRRQGREGGQTGGTRRVGRVVQGLSTGGVRHTETRG
jgi:hypothetical protein